MIARSACGTNRNTGLPASAARSREAAKHPAAAAPATKPRRSMSVALKGALDFADIARGRQHQCQQDTRLLRAEVFGGDNAGLAQAAARRDAPGGAAALHDDDPGL